MFVGDKASNEFDVGGDNAQLDVRFERETSAHGPQLKRLFVMAEDGISCVPKKLD
jgi:hypothetical protein